MSDGIFNSNGAEQIKQAKFTRHRFLVVNTDPNGDVNAGEAYRTASSSYASLDPGDLTQPVSNAAEMGPHFVMSGETSDGVHTYGLQFCLLDHGFQGTPAEPEEEGFIVTVWGLIANLQVPQATPDERQPWAGFLPLEGVGFRQWWHSFDLNAMAIRFQFTNVAVHGNIGIVIGEI